MDDLRSLTGHLREAVRRNEDPDGFEVMRQSHHVFGAHFAGEDLIVKLFSSQVRDEPIREWEGLCALQPLAMAPRPVWFEPASDLPAVVMSRVPGAPRDAAALSAENLVAIGEAHLAVGARGHPSPDRVAINHPATLLSRVQAKSEQLGPDVLGAGQHDANVKVAWARGGEWLQTEEAGSIARTDRLVFCRGDCNLVNYMFDGDRLSLVDLEDSGMNDPAFELVDMAEHLNARAISESAWEVMADVLQLQTTDRVRYRTGRRLMAIFWLQLLVGREGLRKRRGPETPEEQATRVLALLDGSAP